MNIKIYQVDAFTDVPFRGNPAAVCMLPGPAEETWMASIAREMNLSETAFLYKKGDDYHLRWFTPAVEVSLCGHATLASAHILYETGLVEIDQEIRFNTASGLLTTRMEKEEIELNFPSNPPQETTEPAGLTTSLGVTATYIGKSKDDYLVQVGSEREVLETKPDFVGLHNLGVRGVMVTSQGVSESYDFVSRFFAPGAGIDEDPVTGSAHCTLGPFWGDILGKDEMIAYQASTRGGMVRVRVEKERVYISGKAVTVLRGELTV